MLRSVRHSATERPREWSYVREVRPPVPPGISRAFGRVLFAASAGRSCVLACPEGRVIGVFVFGLALGLLIGAALALVVLERGGE